jgi:nucleolar protein 4
MADAKPDRTSDPRTVFVRGVSFEVGDAELTEAFSALGPVRNAFLIKAGKGGRHKGFGFVQFALQEDADRAVAELDGTELGGRKVRVEGANKRAPLEERKQKRKVPVEGDGGDAPDGEAPAPAAAAAAAEPTAKKPRSAPAAAPAPAPAAADGGKKGSEKHALVRSVALGGLTPQTLEAAVALARGTGAVQAVANPAPQPIVERYKLAQDGCTGEVVMLTYASARDACAAVAELHGQQVAGGRKGRGGGTAAGTTLWARQVSGEGLHLKRWRVVVRNLPFKATEADIRAAFFPAGFIWELTLPRGADGQPRGFAFVGYTCRAHAERAIKLVNGTSVAGRPVAVDWAVAKREYEAAGAAAAEAKPAAAKPAKPVKPAKTAKQVALDTSDEEDEGGPARKPRRAANGAVLGQDDGGAAPAEIEPEQERGMLRSVIDDILGGSGSEGEGAPSAGAAAAAAASEEDEEEGGSEYSSGEEEEAGFDEESGSEGESDEEAAPPGGAAGDMFSRAAIAGGRGEQEAALKRLERQAQRLSAPAVPKTGGGPGCAVFVRGLPLDATREQLFTAMRAFGAVGSCRLVMNKEIDRPKGTAFVDFRVASAAEAAAEACARGRRREGPGVVVAGRAVEVDLALQGDAVRQLAAEKAGTALPADKRNLYLVRAEGGGGGAHVQRAVLFLFMRARSFAALAARTNPARSHAASWC